MESLTSVHSYWNHNCMQKLDTVREQNKDIYFKMYIVTMVSWNDLIIYTEFTAECHQQFEVAYF
jgi:hypothetical protein